MMQRLFDLRLCAVLVLAWLTATAQASDPRETPLVRAVKRARASVVNIHSEKSAPAGDALFTATGSGGRKVNGMGTGIVIDERGYIVTNHHVIDGVDVLRCTLDDGSTYDARVVSFDRPRDLAVIKIAASKPLPVMPMGTSSDLMLGETVIAVGNAFGYEHTVTAGIISALSRDVEVNEKQAYKNLIQTDASINPGNSGGPLLNLEGETVGINVAIRAGAQRIGFAIPIDDARRAVARLLSIEQLNHTWHGLAARDVKAGAERKLVVEAATPDSPAAKAGFQRGDVIVRAGSVEVVDAVDFERALLGRSPGDPLEIEVLRNERTETLSLAVARRHKDAQPAARTDTQVVRTRNEADTTASRTWQTLGLRLTPTAAGERPLAGTRYRGGMRVTEVRSGSPGETNGIRPGDVLVGLHVWETITHDNIAYILDHPQLDSFSPLKFYILRGHETLFGHLRLAARSN